MSACHRIDTLVRHLVSDRVNVLASSPVSAAKSFSAAEVGKHTTEKDCWLIVNGEVLDVTSFLDKHPGGKQVLVQWAGKDASEEFNMFHKKDVIAKYAPEVILGTVSK